MAAFHQSNFKMNPNIFVLRFLKTPLAIAEGNIFRQKGLKYRLRSYIIKVGITINYNQLIE